jgi:glycosyltransferase involved in cell wall biosynthesis
MPKTKLAIVSTHPIQYYAPIFRALAQSHAVHPRVFFTWSQAAQGAVPDDGFGTTIRWDIPLLEGYEHEFVPNAAGHPGVDRFYGVRNPTLTRAIEQWGADAVLVFGWNLHSHLQVMRKFKARIPVYFRGDSTLLGSQSWWRQLARKLVLTWVYRHIDVAIAVGSNNRDYFAHHGVPSERIAFAPHSVDIGRFAETGEQHEAAAARWREQLAVPADARVLLYAGKLIETKDLGLLLEAFMQADSGAYLVFCGNGALEAELKARAADHPRVRFMPFQNQSAMPAVYRIGDVFVLPSRGETWGLAVNEAMACGRPVIASNRVGGARDLIRHQVDGWIFESGNRSELTQLLVAIAHMDRHALAAMGAAARETAMAWSSEATAAKIAQIVTLEHHVFRPVRLQPQ